MTIRALSVIPDTNGSLRQYAETLVLSMATVTGYTAIGAPFGPWALTALADTVCTLPVTVPKR